MLSNHYLDTGHGGVEGHIYFVARALRKAGHEVTVVRASTRPSIRRAPADPPFLAVSSGRRLRKPLVSVTRRINDWLPELLERLATNARIDDAFARIVLAYPSVDVVHQHDFTQNWRLARRLARHYNAPLVWTNHLGEFLLLRRSRLGTRALRAGTKHYAAILAPSRELADLPWREDVLYQSNGVDVELFRPPTAIERRSAKAALGLHADLPVVLVPRRWAPSKGVLFMAEALQLLPAGLQVVFVGSGSVEYPQYVADIRQMLTQAKQNVLEVPSVQPEDMQKYYRAADLTVIPSLLEATSLAALEAMASGSLVVASDVGGLPEVVRDGDSGWLTPAGDVAALARAIRDVLSLPEAAKARVARAAREMVVERYSWTVVAEAVERVYVQAVGGSR